MLTKDQILNSNKNYLELLDYMARLGYYQIGRIMGFDYWCNRQNNSIFWTSPMTNEDYTYQIANDSMDIHFYCYAWQWTTSQVYLAENAHKEDHYDHFNDLPQSTQ